MDTAGAAAILTLVTGLLGALVAAYLNIRKTRHEQGLETAQSVISEYQDFINRLQENERQRDKVIESLRKENEQIRRELTDCVADLSAAVERIYVYEDLLAVHNIKVKKWKPRSRSSASIDLVPNEQPSDIQ